MSSCITFFLSFCFSICARACLISHPRIQSMLNTLFMCTPTYLSAPNVRQTPLLLKIWDRNITLDKSCHTTKHIDLLHGIPSYFLRAVLKPKSLPTQHYYCTMPSHSPHQSRWHCQHDHHLLIGASASVPIYGSRFSSSGSSSKHAINLYCGSFYVDATSFGNLERVLSIDIE
jgi:hypothetical protein